MKRIGRGVVIALAIVGTLAVLWVGLAVLLGPNDDRTAPTTGLCRNPDFNPYEAGSREFVPCNELQAEPLDAQPAIPDS